MKNTFRIMGALASLLAASGSGANAEVPFSSGSFKEACAAAGKTKRIVMIDFYTTWCGPCKLLDKNTWTDKNVRVWLARTAVCRKTDAEKETTLANRYHIRAYPTILLLRPDGKEIDRLVGYRDPKTFLVEARQALSGQDSIARAKARLTSTGKNDPMERMKYADALKEKGRNAEALTEYLWCLDEGNKHNQAFYGVRLSFLLSDIKTLGADYPPALDALKQRRDAARAALEKNGTHADAAADFAAYNETLGQPEQTLAAYDALRTASPQIATELFHSVSSLLLDRKRYADLVTGAGDISALTDTEFASYKTLLTDARADKDFRAYMKQNVIDKCSGYYEALVGTDKRVEADALRDKLLAFDGAASTYVGLVQHAARAGKPEMVQSLMARAKSALPSEDYKQVERAAK